MMGFRWDVIVIAIFFMVGLYMLTTIFDWIVHFTKRRDEEMSSCEKKWREDQEKTRMEKALSR